MSNPAWAPVTAVTIGRVVIDASGNVQQCVIGGITGAQLPQFASVVGGSTTDGPVTWTCVAVLAQSSLPPELVGLPAPTFVNDTDGLNPDLILNDMVATFEASTGRTLYPAQIERLLINLYAYRESLVRNLIQYAGQQCLLAFANYPAIDYLGELVGVARLDAVGAQTRIQFALAEILATDYVIPAGTLVGTQDGKFQFATVEDLIIQSGGDPGPSPRARSVDAVCTTKGPDGNGYAVGQVSVFLPAHPSIALISNITRTAGGAAIESTDALRARIQLAPNRFTSAGPSGAYKFFALSADPSIADVQVIGHWLDGVVINTVPPGTVKVFVLPGPIIQPAAAGTQGIASGALITEIQTALSADTIRPLTDTVVVSAVTDRNYQVKGLSPNGVTLERNVDPTSAMAALREAARNLALRIGSRIGADIVPEEWIAALGSIGSVHRVVLSEPAYSKLGPGEWANCTAITLDVTDAAGVTRGTISL